MSELIVVIRVLGQRFMLLLFINWLGGRKAAPEPAVGMCGSRAVPGLWQSSCHH